MKDIVRGLVLFCVLYLLWNLVWRGAFFAWDVLGFGGSILVAGLICTLCKKCWVKLVLISQETREDAALTTAAEWERNSQPQAN